ncbi:suppressor of tumorigenicity 14 protein-like [Mytilus trossulus]|uniref:suppressor of tumorigenicity 14 protein-like n=1 Tax=Mytilus trossulus TaxID=6551 RepID=UPI0030063A46
MLRNFIFVWLFYVVAAVHVGPQNNTDRPCPNGKVKCADGLQCIHFTSECDGFEDCDDGSDEGKACKGFNCTKGYKKCMDKKQCIKATYRCDTFVDCIDSSDEGDCELQERRLRRPYYRREHKLFSKHNSLPITKTKPVFRKSVKSEKFSNNDLLDKLAELIARTN